MADYTNKKYEFSGTSVSGEDIILTVGGATPFSESTPAWATSATINIKVQFNKA